MTRSSMYHAVYGTRRGDLSESIVALVSTQAFAREVAKWAVESKPRLMRCRVRRVTLTREQVVEVVGGWGREDGAAGLPESHADRLSEPFRGVYLAAYRATAARHAGPKSDSGGSG